MDCHEVVTASSFLILTGGKMYQSIFLLYFSLLFLTMTRFSRYNDRCSTIILIDKPTHETLQLIEYTTIGKANDDDDD